jgi:hypothetical protein
MTLARFFLAALTAFSFVSCSTSKSTAPTDPVNPDENVPVGLSAKALRVVIPTHTVEPGDSYECYYTDITTDREIYVNSATGKQGPGGHHITIYYATVSQAPGHHKCIDVEMAEWRQVGAASDDPKGDGVIDLPDGIAVKVPAGKQIVVQTHYINATATAKEVADEITVHLLAKEEVKRFAQGFVVVDGTFEIPPRADYSRTASCTVKQDLQLIMALGTPDQPYKLTKGEKLRQTCTWKNTDEQKVLFPLEMCIAFTMYLDDDGFLECMASPDAPK